MINKVLYTVLYPFMSAELDLHGYEKETFAVIFNFWLAAGEKPVRASLTVIQKITGGSRPSIVQAIASLVDKEFIFAEKNNGKPTYYTITISPEILHTFKTNYQKKPVKFVNRPELNTSTTSCSIVVPHKINKAKFQRDMTLRVLNQNEITTGGLPEAK